MAKGDETRRSIEKQLLVLLRTKPIDEIKVTEITSALNMHRSTFYRYYDSVYDLVEQIEYKLLGTIDARSREEYPVEQFEAFMENRDELVTLIKFTQNEPYFLSRMERRVVSVIQREYLANGLPFDPDLIEMYAHYMNSGHNALIMWWYEHGCIYPAEQMANLFSSLTKATREAFASTVLIPSRDDPKE